MTQFSIDKKHLIPCLHAAAMETLEQKLRDDGFAVLREVKHPGAEFDLVATRGTETIIYEIKISGQTSSPSGKISQIRKAAKDFYPNARVQLVFIPYPVNREIEINDLELKIELYFLANFPSELDALSTHTRIREVADVDLTSISISGTVVTMSGSGALSVGLQYGSDGDLERGDGLESTVNVPFTFDAEMNLDGELVAIDPCEFDLSSFYQDDEPNS